MRLRGAGWDEAETVQAFRRLGGEHAAQVASGDPADPEGGFTEWLRVCWPLVSRTEQGVRQLHQTQELSTHSHDVHSVHARKGLEARPLPDLDKVTCTVLMIGGREGPRSTPAVTTDLAESLATSTSVCLVLIPGAGHALFVDQPDATYGVVTDFLKETSTLARACS